IPATSNWKNTNDIEVSGFLQIGKNTIEARVFNDDGPAALWFRLRADAFQLRSDSTWEASIAGSAWRPAALATAPRFPRLGNLLAGGETTFAVLRKIWPAWIALAIAAVFLVSLARRLASSCSEISWRKIGSLLGVAGVAGPVLFGKNNLLLPPPPAYDPTDHIEYIKYTRGRHALPLPKGGYKFFKPPLYYALSTAALS